MAITRTQILKNVERIRQEISAACERAAREPQEVSMVAVTKSQELETIRNLIEAGVSELGENRAQQLVVRAREIDAWLGRKRSDTIPPIRWHMIGHLQRNKVKATLEHADLVHSVDSLRLAEELETRAAKADKRVEVFLQINCSEEPQKHGVAVGAAMHLGETIASMQHLRLVGLMTMAPLAEDPEQARPAFARLRELFEEMRSDGIGGDDFRHLSMGMSQDYTVAVEEGATMLRIGSALFRT
jgi:hypothetical protein